MQEDFFFLNFGIQTLVRDNRFARALQDGFFRLKRCPEALDQEQRLTIGRQGGGFELDLPGLDPRSRFQLPLAAPTPAFVRVDQEIFQEGRGVGDRQNAPVFPERGPERSEPLGRFAG